MSIKSVFSKVKSKLPLLVILLFPVTPLFLFGCALLSEHLTSASSDALCELADKETERLDQLARDKGVEIKREQLFCEVSSPEEGMVVVTTIQKLVFDGVESRVALIFQLTEDKQLVVVKAETIYVIETIHSEAIAPQPKSIEL